MDTLIQNALIVTASGVTAGDVAIDGERISALGQGLKPSPGCRVIDLKGAYLLPGGIDAHTHFDMDAGDIRTSDDFYTGTRAALAGGTTTIVDFAEPKPGDSLPQGLADWRARADNRSFCDYGCHMTINRWDNALVPEIEAMLSEGVSSFKLYTAYVGLKVADDVLYRVFKAAENLGGLVMVHCENGGLIDALTEELRREAPADIRSHPRSRPPLAEKEAVSRVIDIAAEAGAPVYIVHLSAAESLEAVEDHRRRGARVIVETCPHYLLLNQSRYDMPDASPTPAACGKSLSLRGFEAAKYVMSPPLRSAEDQQVLWAALSLDQIQTVSTDHCSFDWARQKIRGRDDFSQIPSGIPSVEHRMVLMFTYGVKQGRISLPQYAALTSTNPAKIFGLYPQKGEIKPGSDADLVVLEEAGTGRTPADLRITAAEQLQAVDYTPYEGFQLAGRIAQVFLRGRCAFDNGIIKEGPQGRFLKRPPRSAAARLRGDFWA